MDHIYHKKVATDSSFTILEFRQVLIETKNQLMAILRKQPYSMNDLVNFASPYLTS